MTEKAATENAAPKTWKQKIKGVWRQHILPIGVIVLVLGSMKSAVADWNVVPTGSMRPTIIEGDRIWVNKLAYGLKVPFTTWHVARWGTPQRGDIVVFNSPVDGTRLVKRIVGVPGDTIEMSGNRLVINGEALAYGFIDKDSLNQVDPSQRAGHMFAEEKLGAHQHPVMATPSLPAQRSFESKTIPERRYFVMGDNRDNSKDSRYIGFVPEDEIVGRSSSVVMSLNYDDYYLPRWGRFFRGLP